MDSIEATKAKVLAEYLKDKVIYFHKREKFSEEILQILEQVEVDYHNKWEEMKLEEQYQEKPE